MNGAAGNWPTPTLLVCDWRNLIEHGDASVGSDMKSVVLKLKALGQS